MNLVYVGIDRQLHVVSGWEQGRLTTTPLTAPPSFTLVPAPQEAWSWPTWSPDGTWIAAFATLTRDDEAGPALGVQDQSGWVRKPYPLSHPRACMASTSASVSTL